jgi:hypothetical protein
VFAWLPSRKPLVVFALWNTPSVITTTPVLPAMEATWNQLAAVLMIRLLLVR